MKKKESPFYNEAVERALEQRAREDLERKAMEKARARLIAGERIVAGGYRHIFRIFCDTSERSRSAIDILCGHLARCCPRLIAVDKEFFVLFILMPEFERRRNERYRARGN